MDGSPNGEKLIKNLFKNYYRVNTKCTESGLLFLALCRCSEVSLPFLALRRCSGEQARSPVYRLQSVYSVDGLRDFLRFLARRAIPLFRFATQRNLIKIYSKSFKFLDWLFTVLTFVVYFWTQISRIHTNLFRSRRNYRNKGNLYYEDVSLLLWCCDAPPYLWASSL